MPRRRLRTCPMAAAASWSWPVTSPMTRQAAPAAVRNASCQSPPTWRARRRAGSGRRSRGAPAAARTSQAALQRLRHRPDRRGGGALGLVARTRSSACAVEAASAVSRSVSSADRSRGERHDSPSAPMTRSPTHSGQAVAPSSETTAVPRSAAPRRRRPGRARHRARAAHRPRAGPGRCRRRPAVPRRHGRGRAGRRPRCRPSAAPARRRRAREPLGLPLLQVGAPAFGLVDAAADSASPTVAAVRRRKSR